MTITFKKKLPSESDQAATAEANASERVASKSWKRAQRRMRNEAAKQGMIIPYEPRSQPRVVDPDAPKLTNHAKRMARKRKKFAAEMAALGMTVEEGGPTYFKTKKRKNKKKNSPVVGLVTNSRIVIDQSNTAENPAEVQPEESQTGAIKKKKKKSKKTKKSKKDGSVADNASLLKVDETSTQAEKNDNDNLKRGKKRKESMSEVEDEKTSDKAERRKRKKKAKMSKDEEQSTQAAEDNIGDVSPPEEEVKVKVENESGDEEMPSSEAALAVDTLIQEEIKVEMPAIPKKHRFILFVGNLSYDATEPDIRAHFSKVGKIVSIRISKHVDKAMEGKNKGCAHLEVADEESYLKALSMHHSKMQGRRINVEFSSAQTKDMRHTQKEANRAMRAAMAADNILDLANPCGSKKKKQKPRRSANRRQTPAKTNQVWM